jgi:hypothetical protein
VATTAQRWSQCALSSDHRWLEIVRHWNVDAATCWMLGKRERSETCSQSGPWHLFWYSFLHGIWARWHCRHGPDPSSFHRTAIPPTTPDTYLLGPESEGAMTRTEMQAIWLLFQDCHCRTKYRLHFYRHHTATIIVTERY